MKKVSKYMIPFRGLKDGIHFFEFSIDNSFFEELNFFDFGDAKLDLNITLDKKSSILTLKFDFNGFVKLSCDLTTESFDYNLKTDFRLVVKFGEVEKYDGDEILILQNGASQIDISQYIYETIILAIPQKKIHPGVIDGTLDSDIIKKLRDLQPKTQKKLNKKIDPRWVKLKDLL
tara:strand:- start:424 stop:948 length:525 start_codon:yes stop_codon:yes gene_type:complete